MQNSRIVARNATCELVRFEETGEETPHVTAGITSLASAWIPVCEARKGICRILDSDARIPSVNPSIIFSPMYFS